MSRGFHLDTFASDKTRVSLISWRVTRSEKEEEEECDCEMTFPDKSWLMIVDSGGGKRGRSRGGKGRGEPVWTSCFQEEELGLNSIESQETFQQSF